VICCVSRWHIQQETIPSEKHTCQAVFLFWWQEPATCSVLTIEIFVCGCWWQASNIRQCSCNAHQGLSGPTEGECISWLTAHYCRCVNCSEHLKFSCRDLIVFGDIGRDMCRLSALMVAESFHVFCLPKLCATEAIMFSLCSNVCPVVPMSASLSRCSMPTSAFPSLRTNTEYTSVWGR